MLPIVLSQDGQSIVAPNPLKNYRILIADADHRLSQVLKFTLGDMGFPDVHTTRGGLDAISMLEDKPFDFVITEWNTRQIDGIELINRIRRDPKSINPALPIIMLTGRAEKSDVATARDSGINEFIVKPFSARTIYSRIEHVIERPRPFVVSKNFVGPDRRHGLPPAGTDDRRTVVLKAEAPPAAKLNVLDIDTPKLWLPEKQLKEKLGRNVKLESLIPKELLDRAQASIDAISEESLQWIKQDLAELKVLYGALESAAVPDALIAKLCEVALNISSRAGTFGYKRAAEVSHMLYIFCRKQMNTNDPHHHTIIEKHIEVLQVILGGNVRGMAGTAGDQIINELRLLIQKHA